VPLASRDVSEPPVGISPLPLKSPSERSDSQAIMRLRSVVYGFAAKLIFIESEVVCTNALHRR
jgi:hypothetical protein